MKHILTITTLLFILIGCKHSQVTKYDQSEIEHLIEERIKKSLSDDRIYLPLFFTELDSAKSSVKDTPQYQKLQAELYKIDSSFVYDERAALTIENQLNELRIKYKPHYIGMELSHAYISTTDFDDSLYIETYIINNLSNIQKTNTISTAITQEEKAFFKTATGKDKIKKVYELFYMNYSMSNYRLKK